MLHTLKEKGINRNDNNVIHITGSQTLNVYNCIECSRQFICCISNHGECSSSIIIETTTNCYNQHVHTQEDKYCIVIISLLIAHQFPRLSTILNDKIYNIGYKT